MVGNYSNSLLANKAIKHQDDDISLVALLSVAAGDRQGRPAPETLEAVKVYNLLRTDRNGWIELTTDGEQMWVGVEGR